MCTALTFTNRDCYFGRTLDLEYNYNEEIVVAPRKFPFHFRKCQSSESHVAVIGTATVTEGYPLYYDATNEAGLNIAALSFDGHACYFEKCEMKINLAPFEFIPWIMCNFNCVNAVCEALKSVNIINDPFSECFPNTPLHWIISDSCRSVVVESVASGLKVYKNPLGILTNAPEFPWHITNLSNYRSLTSNAPENTFSNKLNIKSYSNGLGAFGLPGDGSSASRFVRAAFAKFNSVGGTSEAENVSRFFHIMDTVSQVRGCVKTGSGKDFYTVYTSCCNADKCIYYYTTYENRAITSVCLYDTDYNSNKLIRYPMSKTLQINKM